MKVQVRHTCQEVEATLREKESRTGIERRRLAKEFSYVRGVGVFLCGASVRVGEGVSEDGLEEMTAVLEPEERAA